jgi:hypothetical protein
MQRIKKEPMNRTPERLQDRIHYFWDCATSGMRMLAVHETDALRGHWSEINERLELARRARDSSELLREQVDLLPESRNRLVRDHQIRVELLRGLIKDLSLH